MLLVRLVVLWKKIFRILSRHQQLWIINEGKKTFWGEHHLVSLRGQLNKLNTLNEIPLLATSIMRTFLNYIDINFNSHFHQDVTNWCVSASFTVFNGAKIHINWSSAVEKTTTDQALNWQYNYWASAGMSRFKGLLGMIDIHSRPLNPSQFTVVSLDDDSGKLSSQECEVFDP